jgi:hypothetical protein
MDVSNTKASTITDTFQMSHIVMELIVFLLKNGFPLDEMMSPICLAKMQG